MRTSMHVEVSMIISVICPTLLFLGLHSGVQVAEAAPRMASATPNPAVVVPGGAEVVLTLSGTGLEQIAQCAIVRNKQIVAGASVSLGAPSPTARQARIRANVGTLLGDAQLRVFYGNAFTDIPLNVFRISISAPRASSAVRAPQAAQTTQAVIDTTRRPTTITTTTSNQTQRLQTQTQILPMQTQILATQTQKFQRCTNTWTPTNYRSANTAEYQNTAASPTYQNYKPSIKIASKWNGPWYAPGEYLYVTITLDAAHCDEGYIVSRLISEVTSYIPWAGPLVSWQFRQTANEIVSKNRGYGVKIVLKLPVVAVGVPLATNTVTSAPPTPPGPVLNEILGMSAYAWFSNAGSMSEMPWGKNDMGQGPYALSWLAADVDKDGKAELIQPWKNGDKLGMLVYGWDGRWIVAKWGTDDMGNDFGYSMGTASGAYAWLVADIDGDGKVEIIQPWNNLTPMTVPADQYRWLGMNVYGWDSCQIKIKWATKDVSGWGSTLYGPQLAPAVWLAGDVDGDGKTEIITLMKAGNSPAELLSIFVFGWNGSQMVTKWRGIPQIPFQATDSALAWLVGDIDKDGKTEIIQPWKNGDKLGMYVYGWNGRSMVMKWSSQNMGTAPSALSWLVGDVDGDGKAEIIQPWVTEATASLASGLAMNAYGWDGSNMVVKWSSNGTVYQGSVEANAWLVGDVDGDGRAEIIQRVIGQGPVNGKVGWKHYGLVGTGSIARMVIKPGTVTNWSFGVESSSWLVGDINGDGKADIIQPWTHALLE